jgi:galactokinase/mevalonate kinase-like predicted kinase
VNFAGHLIGKGHCTHSRHSVHAAVTVLAGEARGSCLLSQSSVPVLSGLGHSSMVKVSVSAVALRPQSSVPYGVALKS